MPRKSGVPKKMKASEYRAKMLSKLKKLAYSCPILNGNESWRGRSVRVSVKRIHERLSALGDGAVRGYHTAVSKWYLLYPNIVRVRVLCWLV